VGARKTEQALENAKAGSIYLAPGDIKKMSRDADALGKPA
jgi:aryl-alcohol dehydrogenase-like predicted oxidoreductase